MEDCVFCQFVRGEAPVHTVLETDRALAFLDNHPAAEYHTLVIPKRHAKNVFDVPEVDWLAVAALVRDVAALYRDRLGVENVEVVHCAGAEAQQEVFHLHVHVLPRHADDGQDTDWTRYPAIEDRLALLIDRLGVDGA